MRTGFIYGKEAKLFNELYEFGKSLQNADYSLRNEMIETNRYNKSDKLFKIKPINHMLDTAVK